MSVDAGDVEMRLEERRHHERRREHFARRLVIFKLRRGEWHMAQTTATLLVGETAIFGEAPNPVGSTIPSGTTLAWTSSDVTIGTVTTPDPDSTGVTSPVTGVAPGTFTLTCTGTEPGGNTISGTCVVTVSAPTATDLTISKISG
jgi:hypothetical protein